MSPEGNSNKGTKFRDAIDSFFKDVENIGVLDSFLLNPDYPNTERIRNLEITKSYFLSNIPLKKIASDYGVTPSRAKEISTRTFWKLVEMSPSEVGEEFRNKLDLDKPYPFRRPKR